MQTTKVSVAERPLDISLKIGQRKTFEPMESEEEAFLDFFIGGKAHL